MWVTASVTIWATTLRQESMAIRARWSNVVFFTFATPLAFALGRARSTRRGRRGPRSRARASQCVALSVAQDTMPTRARVLFLATFRLVEEVARGMRLTSLAISLGSRRSCLGRGSVRKGAAAASATTTLAARRPRASLANDGGWGGRPRDRSIRSSIELGQLVGAVLGLWSPCNAAIQARLVRVV